MNIFGWIRRWRVSQKNIQEEKARLLNERLSRLFDQPWPGPGLQPLKGEEEASGCEPAHAAKG